MVSVFRVESDIFISVVAAFDSAAPAVKRIRKREKPLADKVVRLSSGSLPYIAAGIGTMQTCV